MHTSKNEINILKLSFQHTNLSQDGVVEETAVDLNPRPMGILTLTLFGMIMEVPTLFYIRMEILLYVPSAKVIIGNQIAQYTKLE